MPFDRLDAEIVFPFKLDKPVSQAVQPLFYRPWGIRTIKVKFATHTDLPKLWIRPLNVLPEETALGIYKAYADDSRSLHVTWGGGHENGPCIKSKDLLAAFETPAALQAGDTGYLYFNLIHAGSELPEQASLTLRTFACLKSDGKTVESEQARLILQLQPPINLPSLDEIQCLVPAEQDNIWVVTPGHYLPCYDSRWWPSSDIRYELSQQLPLIVRIEQGELCIDWEKPGNTIAVIQDYTNPSVLLLGESLAFDLFAFDPWSVVLRVWFIWVDKYIGGGYFLGRHEVPDSERFDLIIRRKDGRVLLAGTDLHWREVWARVLPNKILRATLGMPRETAILLARQKLGETWSEIWQKSLHRQVDEVEIIEVNNPVEPFIRRLAEREATVTIKAGGTEAHLPTLHNVEQRRPPVMTSSDVRLG